MAPHFFLEVDAGAGDVAAGGCEHADHAGAGIGRSADDLDIGAVAEVDQTHPQPVGVRVFLGRDHAGDAERRIDQCRFVNRFDLEADHGQRRDDLVETCTRVEMLLQPGQGELHDGSVAVSRTSTTRKRSQTSVMSSLNMPCRPK